jgi:copper chaperone
MKEAIVVRGMTCRHCVMAVRRAIEGLPGVESVSVNLETGYVEITGNEEMERNRIRKAVEDEGYTVES